MSLTVPISAEDHIQGDLNAPFNLVEYGDYQCPSCGAAYPIVKQLQKHFGDRLVFIFRNFPLSQLHPWAESAAEAAEFAGVHGKFWEMHNLLFENQDSLSDELFQNLAAELKLPATELARALANHEYKPRIRADFSSGIRSGVNGTPTFFVNGRRHNGPFDFDFLREAIDAALSKG
jgi:protein-disulfide isomerase